MALLELVTIEGGDMRFILAALIILFICTQGLAAEVLYLPLELNTYKSPTIETLPEYCPKFAKLDLDTLRESEKIKCTGEIKQKPNIRIYVKWEQNELIISQDYSMIKKQKICSGNNDLAKKIVVEIKSKMEKVKRICPNGEVFGK